MKTLTATPTVMNRLSKDAQSQINDAKRQAITDMKSDDLPKDEKPTKPKEKKLTKKQIVIQYLEKESGSSIGDIAQAIVDLNIDPDLEKNKRVVRLWISKIGFKVERTEAGLYKKM